MPPTQQRINSFPNQPVIGGSTNALDLCSHAAIDEFGIHCMKDTDAKVEYFR